MRLRQRICLVGALAVLGGWPFVVAVAKADGDSGIPAAFLGIWDSGSRPCGGQDDSFDRVDVSVSQIRFYEMTALVHSVTQQGANRIRVNADLVVDGDEPGKGDRDLSLVLSRNGQALTISGFARPVILHLNRCPSRYEHSGH